MRVAAALVCVHRCRLRDFRSRVFPGAEKKREMRAGYRIIGVARDSRREGFSRIFYRACQGRVLV